MPVAEKLSPRAAELLPKVCKAVRKTLPWRNSWDIPDLTKQAVDGWIRVLYLKYGTEYAQKAGKDFVEKLKK